MLRFGEEITADEVTVTQSSTSIVFTVLNNAGDVRWHRYFEGDQLHVDAVEFADGLVWTSSEIEAFLAGDLSELPIAPAVDQVEFDQNVVSIAKQSALLVNSINSFELDDASINGTDISEDNNLLLAIE